MFVSSTNVLFLDERPKHSRARGERHANAKITDEEVALIRREAVEKSLSQTELSRLLGISQAQVSRIANWKQRRCRA